MKTLMKNKNDIHKTTIVALVLLMIAISIISGVLSYKSGYKKAGDDFTWRYSHNVYVSPSGKKCHLPNCYHIRNSQNLKAMQIEQALQKGYGGCSYCEPERILEK